MRPEDSKRLVIDTTIVSAAGRTDHTVSRACRVFLESVLNICHHVVITRQISDEWKRHQSHFAVSWLASMFARRKVAQPEIAPDEALRAGIQNSDLTEKECAAALKDAHLIEAALRTDLAVASLDEIARAAFRKAAPRVGSLKPVRWVNPTKDDEHTIEWLKGGAEDEEARELGFDDSA